MRKLLLPKLAISLLFLAVFTGCEEEDPPIAEFSASKNDAENGIYITFTDLSSKGPGKWEWTFEGGYPNTSTEQNPTIFYNTPGTFNVTLKASNDGGSNEIIKEDYINVVRFESSCLTDAEVKLGNQVKTLPANSDVSFALINNISSTCYIETSGKDVFGEQVGLLIYWEFITNLTQYYIYSIGVSNDVVFFNITNNSSMDFSYFVVNYSHPSYESVEEVYMPNNGIKTPLGYYVANDGMEIRAYNQGGYYSWYDNYDFNLSWRENQYIDLEISSAIKTLGKSVRIKEKSMQEMGKAEPSLDSNTKKQITESGFQN